MENRLYMKLNVVPVSPVGKVHLSSGEIAAQKDIDDIFDKLDEDAESEMIEKKHCFRCGNEIGIDYYDVQEGYLCHDCGKKIIDIIYGG